MTDHAKEDPRVRTIRNQLYNRDAMAAWRDLDSIAAELAGHAAEVEQLRQETAEALARAEVRCIAHAAVSVLNGDCPICDVEQAERERDEACAEADALREQKRAQGGLAQKCHELTEDLREARADAETLRQENERLREGFRHIRDVPSHSDLLLNAVVRYMWEVAGAALAAAQEPPAACPTHDGLLGDKCPLCAAQEPLADA